MEIAAGLELTTAWSRLRFQMRDVQAKTDVVKNDSAQLRDLNPIYTDRIEFVPLEEDGVGEIGSEIL
ncbi:MAG: hypothetical protein HOC71_11845 [Candidatus Latescibacteria bacterium]|nr:hypothetical protein [Candidatus Latescibacterota bacterium]